MWFNTNSVQLWNGYLTKAARYCVSRQSWHVCRCVDEESSVRDQTGERLGTAREQGKDMMRKRRRWHHSHLTQDPGAQRASILKYSLFTNNMRQIIGQTVRLSVARECMTVKSDILLSKVRKKKWEGEQQRRNKKLTDQSCNRIHRYRLGEDGNAADTEQHRSSSNIPRTARLTLGYPILRWSYEKSIGSKLITDKQTLHDFNFDDDSSDPECLCDLPEWAPYKCKDGHVCTTNLNCITHQGYRTLCKKGVSFKSTPTGKNCVQLVENAINNYIRQATYLTNTLGIHPIEFEEWRLNIIGRAKSQPTGGDTNSGCHVNWKQLKKVQKSTTKPGCWCNQISQQTFAPGNAKLH